MQHSFSNTKMNDLSQKNLNRRRKEYFDLIPDAPPPVSTETKRKIRFSEVDSLGIVWHGNYTTYFEDGRVDFGEKYGLEYLAMYRENFIAPIVRLEVDYVSPITFPEEITIKTIFHWSESVRMNFQYEITGSDERLVATGCTVQLLTNLKREILLARPQMLETFYNKWMGH